MSLLDVDLDAPRRIEGIAADGLRALNEVRQRSADIDKAADEMFERQERARRELDEQVKQAGKPEEKPGEDRPRPKRTLSLGGEEFHEARAATRPETPKPAPAPPKPEPEVKDEPGRTLKLGARDDDEPRPARRPRPERPEGDDDMSGRTWLR